MSVSILTSVAPAIILDPHNPGYCKDAVSSTFKVNGIEYILKREVARIGGARKEVSKCWKYGRALVRTEDKKEYYYCLECERNKRPQTLPKLNGTAAGRYHMKNAHNRDPDTGDKIVKEAVKGAVYQLVERKNYDVFKELLIRWFVCCQLAFFMLENTIFRELVVYLNAALGGLLPRARSTLRRWIMDEYNSRKEALKEELAVSASKIHISFDIWTAGSWIGVISVWAYWVAEGQRERRLLAFRRIYGSHDGDNQAAAILEVLEEYGISKRVGYFVCDNATSNDSAVALILRTLEPALSTQQATGRRLRCFGHIINLAARALLDPSSAELKVAAGELEDDAYASSAWQSIGSLGKLHKLVKYILASPQRREEFGDIKGGRKVKEFDHLGVSCFYRCILLIAAASSSIRRSFCLSYSSFIQFRIVAESFGSSSAKPLFRSDTTLRKYWFSSI